MGRHLTPFELSPRRLVYAELFAYAQDNDTVPNQNAFWEQVLAPKGFKAIMSYSAYAYYWGQLRYVDGLIDVLPGTYAVRVKALKYIEVAPEVG